MRAYSGRTAVITGGGSGVDFATARTPVDGGARVVITGRSRATLDAARERLGANAVAVRGDVASLTDLDTLADRAAAFLAFEATYPTGAELVADGGATQL